ncbi:hypothetical protein CPB85DRAFT_1440568 [Mucidula mucida]|nr:hypothetical protein CPB85DRAFT_1440568 [Mucidula mucida]
MVFCTDALPVMEDMSRLEGMDHFPWRLDSRCPTASRPRSPPPDASDVPWVLPPVEGPRRSRRVRLRDAHEPSARSFEIGTVERDANGEAGYSPRCEDYVQKAWVHAVKTDTTVIVFDCGNFIRIGIRHRERQTLFLSNLIDIRTCKDPAYGGLWTSLQVAAALDALQRLPLLENAALSKRKATFDERHRQIKRRKHDDATLRDQESRSFNQFKCLLDYVSLYGQIPGACGLTKSKGKSSAMDVPDSDGFLHQPFILKLALTGANARRLDHELQVYRHLEQAGVSGIPSLLGYRRGSMDGDPCVLMISDAGQPLGNRLDSEQKVELSTEARIELKSVLTSIHEAGVLHRDVRSWNIMEDEFGRVRFTDFDRSSLEGTPEDYRAEQERLDRFVEGEFIDKDDVIGEDPLRRRRKAKAK